MASYEQLYGPSLKAIPSKAPAVRVEPLPTPAASVSDLLSASVWTPWGMTTPGFAGGVEAISPHLVDPNDRGRITPDNAYDLADRRFRALNVKGQLRAQDFAAIRDAYRAAAGVDPVAKINPKASVGQYADMFAGEYVAEVGNIAQAAAPVLIPGAIIAAAVAVVAVMIALK